MYVSHFRIKEHPGYATVEVTPLIFSGGMDFNPDVIHLNDIQGDEDPNDLFDITYHESAHRLHPFSRELYYRVGKERYIEIRDEDFIELIADLGAMFFLRLKTGTDQRVHNYLSKRPNEDSLKTAYSLFCIGEIGLLGELSNLNQENAKRRIRDILS
ncbi:hypothetical protein GF386_02070 [Candidatus Pacearchaeota archaeon]|nr:hypothetical protein [Candidatus Pacearchaeota archaeon]